MDHIKDNHSRLVNKINQEDWNEFSKVDLQDTDIPINDNRILKWINKQKNDEGSLKGSIKALLKDFDHIWRNNNYQKRSPLINESTFTHDILGPILKFIAPSYFKRWTQAQSLSAKDRGVLKYVDVIGNSENNGHFFENFFVEVSHGLFHTHPEQHIEDDNIKLAKLGKDSLDRNDGYISEDKVLLFIYMQNIYVYV